MTRAWRPAVGVRAPALGWLSLVTAAALAACSTKPPSPHEGRSAAELKALIERHKEWGGHSMVPARVTTMNTLFAVRKELRAGDAAGLMALLQDDAGEVSSMAAHLLACLDDDARAKVVSALELEHDVRRQLRFRDALAEIDEVARLGSRCQP